MYPPILWPCVYTAVGEFPWHRVLASRVSVVWVCYVFSLVLQPCSTGDYRGVCCDIGGYTAGVLALAALSVNGWELGADKGCPITIIETQTLNSCFLLYYSTINLVQMLRLMLCVPILVYSGQR